MTGVPDGFGFGRIDNELPLAHVIAERHPSYPHALALGGRYYVPNALAGYLPLELGEEEQDIECKASGYLTSPPMAEVVKERRARRIAGRLSQLAAQLGLSPAAERALRHNAELEAAHARWLRMADDDLETVEPEPAAPADNAPNGATR
jgi:hypothetical protein